MLLFRHHPPTTELYTLSLHDALPIYYFKAPWMPDRTEANPNELNQDDARYGFRCCHLKNIWTAPLQNSRSEERFSRNAETDLVCRLLLEKKKARATDQLHRSRTPGQA